MTDNHHRYGLSKSICEEAPDQFGQSEDSLAGVISDHNLSVRDFMLLSLVCNQDCFDLDQLRRALGLENNEMMGSVARLSVAGLLCPDDNERANNRDTRICASDAGRELARRILSAKSRES